MRKIKNLIMLILVVAIAGYGIAFGMMNSEQVSVNYLLLQKELPVGLHVSLAMLLGVVAGFIAALGMRRKPTRSEG